MPSDSTVFVDTNVLLYGEDSADGVKQSAALAWLKRLWLDRRGRLSTQVLNEFYVNATCKLRLPMAQADARTEVRRYQQWQPWVADHATVETAWAIESRYRLSYWDALIVASAQAQGCRFLLTEHLQHEQRIDNVQIVNPFFAGPEWLETSKENL